MALLVNDYVNPAGVKITYWKVTELYINVLQQIVRIRLSGYISKEARDNGKEPLETKYFNIPPQKFQSYFNINTLEYEGFNPIKMSYEYIKTVGGGMFKKSLDV